MVVWLTIIISLAVLWLMYYVFLSPTSQVFGDFAFRIKTEKRIVALTFDDGPNEKYTTELLAVLQKHHVHASFFLVGKNLERHPDLGQAIITAGHTVGNHLYSHAFSRYWSRRSFRRELEQTQQTLQTILGITPKFFRPPWLYRDPGLLEIVRKHGLRTMSGLFGSEIEPFQPSAELMAKMAWRKVTPGVILIFHDGYNAQGGPRHQTVAAVDLLIQRLKTAGYTCVTLDQMFPASPNSAEVVSSF